MSKKLIYITCIAVLLVPNGRTAAPQISKQGIVNPIAAVKFEQDGDVKCLSSAIEAGDPAVGASTFILKAPPKCLIPWHYHTAEEQLIVIRGAVLTEMDGISPTVLGPGGFAVMPGKEKHQFSCKSKGECIVVVVFDRKYDIFWVRGSQYLLEQK